MVILDFGVSQCALCSGSTHLIKHRSDVTPTMHLTSVSHHSDGRECASQRFKSGLAYSPIFSGSDTEMFMSKESPPSSSSIYRKQQGAKIKNLRESHFPLNLKVLIFLFRPADDHMTG